MSVNSLYFCIDELLGKPTGASSIGQDFCISLVCREFESFHLRVGVLSLGLFLTLMGACSWFGFIVVELLDLVISWTLIQLMKVSRNLYFVIHT